MHCLCDVVRCIVSVMLLDELSRSEALQQCAAAVRVVGLEITVVVGIAFTAFAIGIVLTATLWFIYTRTGTTAV